MIPDSAQMVERLRERSQAIWHSDGPMLRQAANLIASLEARARTATTEEKGVMLSASPGYRG